VAIAAAALAAAAAPAHAHALTATSTARVVVVSVPGLLWSDLAAMPRLAAYAEVSSVGNLSVRGQPVSTRCADGILTFAAGNRASAGGTTGCALSASQRAALLVSQRRGRFGADIAALGDSLHSAGVTTSVAGPGARWLLADASGTVGTATPGAAAALAHGDVVGIVDDSLYPAPPDRRRAAARHLDAVLGAQLAAIGPTTTTIVAGISDGPAGAPQLHPVIIHGPGWRHAELSSGSTRSGIVQLVDLAPTVLAVLGLPPPSSMIGRAAFDTSHPARSPAALSDVDRHNVAARRLDGSLRTALGIAGMAVVALLVLAWRRRSRPFSRAAVWLSRVALGLPIASYLLQVVPWWRPSLGWYPLMLGAVMLCLAVLTAVAAKQGAAVALVAVPALVVVVLVVDQLLGAPLQEAAPLGNIAVVAGRFRGMGNIAFACLCAAALLTAGIAGGRLRDRGRTGLGLLVAFVLGAIAAVVDAAPRWGNDFGGLLAMTACLGLLLGLLARVRVTVTRVILAALAVVMVAVSLAAVEYARPAADRNDIGTFAGEVLHGGAWRTVRRKLYSDLHSFGNVAVTGSVVLVVVLVIVCRRQVRGVLRRVPGLPEAGIAVGGLAVLGTAVNDSGVVIAQFAVLLGLFAIVGAGLAEPPSDVAGGRAPLSAPAGRLRAPTGGEALPS
jgi:hypothetical protein